MNTRSWSLAMMCRAIGIAMGRAALVLRTLVSINNQPLDIYVIKLESDKWPKVVSVCRVYVL